MRRTDAFSILLAVTFAASRASAQAVPQGAEDDLEVPAASAATDAGATASATTPTPPPAPPASSAPPRIPTPPKAPETSQLSAASSTAAVPVPVPAPPPNAAPQAVPTLDTSGLARAGLEPSLTTGVVGPLGLVFSGYVQGQYESSQLSEDQLFQGQVPANLDRFLVRRARLRVDRSFQWAQTTLEIDGNTTRGAVFGLRRAEASFVYRNPEKGAPPYVRVTGGLSEIPFGYEMTDSSRSRFFMERSQGSLALFPGEPDVGVRVSGGFSFFRYALSYLNGEPVDDRPGRSVRDPNRAKDFVGRVGIDTKPLEALHVTGGLSFLTGRGFHPGKDATKADVAWRDLNENDVIDAGELTAVPAAAATPSESFARFAVGADLRLALTTRFGETRLYGEIFAASNADRGLFVADPIATGADVRELGYYVGFLQDVTRYGVVGFRMDVYNPDADLFDTRVGKRVPANATIHTYSPLVGVMLPDRLRVLFQYDAIVDSLARNAVGVPTDLANNQFTLRVQGEL